MKNQYSKLLMLLKFTVYIAFRHASTGYQLIPHHVRCQVVSLTRAGCMVLILSFPRHKNQHVLRERVVVRAPRFAAGHL